MDQGKITLEHHQEKYWGEDLVAFIQLHSRKVGYCVASVLLVLLLLFVRLLTTPTAPFFDLDRAVQNFQEESLAALFSEEGYQRLVEQFDDFPLLANRYEGKVSELLVALGVAKEKESFIRSTLQPLNEDGSLRPYSEFANISLLIEKGELKSALDEAEKFHTTYSSSPEMAQDPLLLFLNSLHRATLADALGLESGSLWKEVEKLGQGYRVTPRDRFFFFRSLEQLLTQGTISYIGGS